MKEFKNWVEKMDEMTKEFYKDIIWGIQTKTATARQMGMVKEICRDFHITLKEFCENLAK